MEADERAALAPVRGRTRRNRHCGQTFVAAPARAAGKVLECIGKFDGIFLRVAIGKFDRQHTRRTLVVAHEDVMIRMGRKFRIEDRLNFRSSLEISHNFVGILFDLIHADRERTHAAKDQIAVIGAGREAKSFGQLIEVLPFFFVADDDAHRYVRMAAEILCSGDDGNVSTQFQRVVEVAAAVGIVNSYRNVMGMSDLAEFGEINHFVKNRSRAFNEDQLGIGLNQAFNV